MFAFTDESGAFGFKFDKPNVTTHLVITSIIVKENDLDILQQGIEQIRLSYFPDSEIKSSKIGSDFKMRRRILTELILLPFSIFAVVVDKRKLDNYSGLQFKQPFYKFLNNIVHKELRRAYKDLTIVADEIGGSEYMQSFSEYFNKKSDIPTLFGEVRFTFKKSDNSLFIQLADLISGTIARKFDGLYMSEEVTDFIPIIKSKLIRIQIYPQTYENYKLEDSPLAADYDLDIANICLKQVVEFIERYKDDNSPERQCQIIVLDYLLFRFMNNDLRKYIPTKELIKQLATTELSGISTQAFRNKIIAKMRDEKIIIASSPNGYKIPSQKSELFDFINHGTAIIVPMLSRLKTCRDLIKMGTVKELDLFENIENQFLKDILEKES